MPTRMGKFGMWVAKTLAVGLIFMQVMVGFGLHQPRQADAFWGIGDFSFDTIIGNVYDALKDVGIAAAKRIALKYSTKFLTRFVDKLQDKYKIKNYLYYDQILTSHYLTNFIYDKVQDPDLRNIYVLLNKVFITGEATGYSGQPNSPNFALIPALRQEIADLYVKQTGVNPSLVRQRPATMTERDYLKYAQYYYFNPESYTEARLRSDFGAFQSNATTAAQLEVLVGNSLKAGRVLGGTCSGAQQGPPTPGNPEPKSSPTACELAGGTWTPSVLDSARSFINNPTGYLEANMDKALGVIFEGSYDPNNIWSAIGSSLGNYIFNRLELDRGDDVIDEFGSGYTTDTGASPTSRDIDIDLDGIPDGEDADNDGDIDTCFHGGTPPTACTPSTEAVASPYFASFCRAGFKANNAVREYYRFITTNINHFGAGNQNLRNEANVDIWSRRTQTVSFAIDELIFAIQSYQNPNWDRMEIALSQYSHYYSSVEESLIKDKDIDLNWGSGGGNIDTLIQRTAQLLQYFGQIAAVMGQCANPDDTAIGTIVPPDIDAGGGSGTGSGNGACGRNYTVVSGQHINDVETAMNNVLNDPRWSTGSATSSELAAFRDAVASELGSMGITATAGYNGNCRSGESHLAVQLSSTRGELYSVTRDGAPCPGASGNTVYDHAIPCRPGGDSVYEGPWRTVSGGQP